MLLSVCGTMSPISLATRELVRIIAAETIGTPTQIYAVTVEQLRDAWKNISQENRNSLLLYSDAPRANLIQLIIDSDIPVIVCADYFNEILNFNILNTEKELLTALQQVTHTVVQISQLINTGKNLILRSDRYEEPALALAQDIIQFFSLRPTDQQFEKLRARLGAVTLREFITTTFPQWQPTASFDASLPRVDREALETIAQGYTPLIEGRPLEAVHWSPRWFLDGDDPDRQLTAPKPLAGAARMIFSGPRAFLPLGRWDCEIQIELNDCRTDTMALMDIFNGSVLAAVTMRLPRHGVFAADITFENPRPDAPLELRLQLLKGATEGELRLLGMRVRRAGSAGPTPELRLTHASH